MKKIAILICNKTSGKCSSMGCFRAYNNKEKAFEKYLDEDVELAAFFSCARCFEEKEEKIYSIAQRLKDNGIETVHFGACAINCKADRYEENRKIFEDLGIEVIEGTH